MSTVTYITKAGQQMPLLTFPHLLGWAVIEEEGGFLVIFRQKTKEDIIGRIAYEQTVKEMPDLDWNPAPGLVAKNYPGGADHAMSGYRLVRQSNGALLLEDESVAALMAELEQHMPARTPALEVDAKKKSEKRQGTRAPS